jgi:hypothetical protein
MTTIEQSIADLDELKACCKTDEARAEKLEHGIVEAALLAASGMCNPGDMPRAQELAAIALDARQVMCRRFDALR